MLEMMKVLKAIKDGGNIEEAEKKAEAAMVNLDHDALAKYATCADHE